MRPALDGSFLDLIAPGRRFLLTGHEHPDGDCVGAQVALYHLLRQRGCEVAIVNPDGPAKGLAFLGERTPLSAFSPSQALPEFDVAVLLDCAQLSRVGALGERIRAADKTIAVLDHHVGSEAGDGSVCYVDSTAAASGLLVYRLYRELDEPIGPAAAEGVFVSLIADTGWFRYSNTDPEVLAAAAELTAAGVQPSVLYDRMFRRNHLDSVALLETVLGTRRFAFDGKYASASLDKAMMAEAARIDFETDSALDVLRSIDGVEVVGLFKERFDGKVKLSLRASGDVDVRAIAAEFGGGGHVKAAGATLAGPLERARAEIERAVERRLDVAGRTGA